MGRAYVTNWIPGPITGEFCKRGKNEVIYKKGDGLGLRDQVDPRPNHLKKRN